MSDKEKEVFDFINDMYGNAEYFDGAIWYSDEDTGNGYKIVIEVTT